MPAIQIASEPDVAAGELTQDQAVRPDHDAHGALLEASFRFEEHVHTLVPDESPEVGRRLER